MEYKEINKNHYLIIYVLLIVIILLSHYLYFKDFNNTQIESEVLKTTQEN